MSSSYPPIAKSTLINLAGAAVPAALLLITVPIYLHLIGAARYGVLAIVWLMLGYFGVFDLGFGRALANRIAALHSGTAEERQEVFWTGLAISAITGLIGGGILYLLGSWLFAHVLHIHGALRTEAENAMSTGGWAASTPTSCGVGSAHLFSGGSWGDGRRKEGSRQCQRRRAADEAVRCHGRVQPAHMECVDCFLDNSLRGLEYRLWLKDHLVIYGVKNTILTPSYKPQKQKTIEAELTDGWRASFVSVK